MSTAGSFPSSSDGTHGNVNGEPANWVGFVVFGAFVVVIAVIVMVLSMYGYLILKKGAHIRQSVMRTRRARHPATVRTDLESATRGFRNASTTTSSNSIRMHHSRAAAQSYAFVDLSQTYKQLRADGGDAKIPPDQCGSSVEWQVSPDIRHVICLEALQDQSLVRMLPCHHLFHAECIARWFRKHHDTCPICMAPYAGSTLPQEEPLPAPPPPVVLGPWS